MAEALSAILTADQEQRVTILLEKLCAAKLRIATAESCTGGLIASLFTDVPGYSHAFEAGFVTYSDESKQQLLGVDQRVLSDHGAVSEAVAKAMVDGALRRSAADIAIALTGYTGEADAGQEPGLVFAAAGTTNGRMIVSKRHFGDIGRGPARLRCVDAVLDIVEILV